METREGLEKEVKTLKSLRRTHCKDAVLGGVIPLFCSLPTIEYVQNQQPEIAILGVAGTLASIIFSSENISAIREDTKTIKEDYKKIKEIDRYVYSTPKL